VRPSLHAWNVREDASKLRLTFPCGPDVLSIGFPLGDWPTRDRRKHESRLDRLINSVKRIPRHIGKHLAPVKLYLDDIEELHQILAAASDRVELTTEDVELDDPRQLLELNRPVVHELTIASHEPYVSADVKESGVWLYAAKDDAKSRGLYEQMRAVFSRRRRRIAWALAGPQGGLIAGLFLGAAFISGAAAVQNRSTWWGLAFVLTVGLGVISVIYTFRYLSRANVIVLSHRKDSLSFMTRNRDQLAVATFSAVIGAAAGAIATYLLTHH
jgi:hypothetical protein